MEACLPVWCHQKVLELLDCTSAFVQVLEQGDHLIAILLSILILCNMYSISVFVWAYLLDISPLSQFFVHQCMFDADFLVCWLLY
jgi:hypothetical protein